MSDGAGATRTLIGTQNVYARHETGHNVIREAAPQLHFFSKGHSLFSTGFAASSGEIFETSLK